MVECVLLQLEFTNLLYTHSNGKFAFDILVKLLLEINLQ